MLFLLGTRSVLMSILNVVQMCDGSVLMPILNVVQGGDSIDFF